MKIKTVASYSHAHEAHLARARLESEGISTSLADEHTVSINWLYSNAIGGVKVQVKECDFQQAREILFPSQPPEGQEARGMDICPGCGSQKVARVSLGKKEAMVCWLLLGIPLIFVRHRYTCENCHLKWK